MFLHLFLIRLFLFTSIHLSSSSDHRDPPPFPTRRSSDLSTARRTLCACTGSVTSTALSPHASRPTASRPAPRAETLTSTTAPAAVKPAGAVVSVELVPGAGLEPAFRSPVTS